MKKLAIILSALALATLVEAAPNHCSNPNEEWSECGNLCEDSCDNNCDQSVFLPFGNRTTDTNPNCVPGCYCATNNVRDYSGDCVPNEPGVCVSNRCSDVSDNAVYMRCTATAPKPCFKRQVLYMPGGLSGRCMCVTGYSMNSQLKCVQSDDKACTDEAGQILKLVYLPPAPNCSDNYDYDANY